MDCKRKKRQCSVKGLVSQLVATGELTSVEESLNFKISSKEDVVGLGLERGSELILLQLLSFQQHVDERLESIENRLDSMGGVTGGGSDDD